MRITILGTRGNIARSAPKHARHSGVLIDRKLLLDLGERDYLGYGPAYVFITHLHPDHAAFMETPFEIQAALYVPERTKNAPDAHVVTRSTRVASYRVSPVPTIHSHRTRSLGYVVEAHGRRLFYSSDMVSIDRRYERRLENLDLVITDGSYMRKGGLVRTHADSGERYGHTGVPDLVEFFRPFAKRIVITHFGSWFYRDVEESVRKIEALSNGVEVLAAYDGLTLRIE